MRILVVEDDEAMQVALRRCLALEGHEAVPCASAAAALDELRGGAPDAAILDRGLPDMDGLELCRRIRAAGDAMPILFLTARGDVDDRVAGLDAGADDYVVKPFELEELLARLRALLRRVDLGGGADPAAAGPPAPLVVGDLVLDLGRHAARRGEREIALTRTELALLEVLMRNAGQVLERGQLMRDVWDYDFGGSGANLEVYVGYLRRKLEAGGEPRMIHTVRGVGYTLRASGDGDA